jgi:cell wall-associated NlpC family hydrolase
VASHRRPKSPNRARISVLTAAAATAVAICSNAQSAQAAPPQTIAGLTAQIDQLNTQADTAVQKYDAAQEQQQQEQQQVNQLQEQVARQQSTVTARQTAIGAVAAAQYRDGSMDPEVQLMLSSDPTDYLSQASTMDQVTSSQAAQLSGLRSDQAALTKEQAEAEAKLQALDRTSTQLAAAKADVQRKLAAAQAMLDSLTAQQRAAVAAAQAKADAATGGSGTGGGSGSGSGGGGSVGTAPGGAAGDAAEAAAFAAAQTKLGDPYVYGATGPDSFDCSGLMQWAYAQAGIAIGRTTYDQINAGTPVASVADLKVGDLIFFNDDSHVGMYAGGGMVLHAPHTGTVVKYESLDTIGTIYAMRHL